MWKSIFIVQSTKKEYVHKVAVQISEAFWETKTEYLSIGLGFAYIGTIGLGLRLDLV